MKKVLQILVLSLFLASCDYQKLNTSVKLQADWFFSKKGDTIWYQATVPGVIHTDLLANNLINDPFWETNELNLQWIESEDWNYQTSFEITKYQFENDFIELEFEGLDTYADVYLNNHLIISANNMFRSWKKEVKNYLKVGKNTLEVKFISPLNKHNKTVQNYPYQLPSGNESAAIKVSPFSRKAAYHFGWDWAPRFVTLGIWKPIKINTWNSARINDIFVKTDSISNNKAYLSLNLNYSIKKALNQSVRVECKDIQLNSELDINSNSFKYSFVVNNPKLWWPNGMGKSYLNELEISLKRENRLLEKRKIKYGIRTVDLINEEDRIGTSFYFKVNGKPLFVKGANYIPQDVFLPRISNEKYKKLISKVVAANMNMLRVWGGGIYEKDIFYELCDKNGILVWQDFMFANSLYPSNDEFIKNIEQEVQDNVKRLRKHPSIALWCGNNEIEVAWHNWGWQKQFNYSKNDSLKLWNDYEKLFHEIIPNTLNELDASANYTTSSPLSNWGTPENFNHSSMHYWGVWHGKEPFETFNTNVGRFMVEYGFQSFPSMKTIQKFASDSSFNLMSKTMLNRQKSYIGNGLILEHINRWFDTPISFEDFVVKSQKTQAIGYQMAIQAHRSQSPHCMGTLFWQLNDCWPGPSWSVLDYYGNEKIAYKTVKENYKPIIVVCHLAKNKIEIINDSESLFQGILEIKIDNKVNASLKVSVDKKQRKSIDFKFDKLNSNKPNVSLFNEKDVLIYQDIVYLPKTK